MTKDCICFSGALSICQKLFFKSQKVSGLTWWRSWAAHTKEFGSEGYSTPADRTFPFSPPPTIQRPTHRPTLRVPHTCTISGTPTILPPILAAIILEIPRTYLFYIWLNPSFTQTMNRTLRCSVGSTSVISLAPCPIHCCCTLVAPSRHDTHAPAAASDPNLAELFQAWPYSTQSLRFTLHSAPANQDQPHQINFLAKNLYNQLTCILWISHMSLVTSLWIDILCGQVI